MKMAISGFGDGVLVGRESTKQMQRVFKKGRRKYGACLEGPRYSWCGGGYGGCGLCDGEKLTDKGIYYLSVINTRQTHSSNGDTGSESCEIEKSAQNES